MAPSVVAPMLRRGGVELAHDDVELAPVQETKSSGSLPKVTDTATSGPDEARAAPRPRRTRGSSRSERGGSGDVHGSGVEVAQHRLEPVERLGDPGVELASPLGGLHAGRLPHEQRLAQDAFQRGQLLAGGGLGQAPVRCALGHRPAAVDGHEGAEPVRASHK